MIYKYVAFSEDLGVENETTGEHKINEEGVWRAGLETVHISTWFESD